MITKKIDSTIFFGKAEQYLAKADYTRLQKAGIGRAYIQNLDPLEIQKKYSIKGFVFGNYVSQEERVYFLIKTSKQLEFLAKLKRSNNLGLNKLIIGFGANGVPKSLAHYNPSSEFINLNRGNISELQKLKGENSFIHEYGHFLDFQIGRSDKNISVNFGSEIKASEIQTANKKTLYCYDFVNIARYDEDYMFNLNTPYLRKDIEIFARLFEATITQLAMKDNSYKQFFTDRYDAKIYLPKNKISKSKAPALSINILKSI